jgi:hypothetical protein
MSADVGVKDLGDKPHFWGSHRIAVNITPINIRRPANASIKQLVFIKLDKQVYLQQFLLFSSHTEINTTFQKVKVRIYVFIKHFFTAMLRGRFNLIYKQMKIEILVN